MTSTDSILDELTWRGLVHQITNAEGLRQHLESPRKVYCGFDPTKDSLTIGNLVSIVLLVILPPCCWGAGPG